MKYKIILITYRLTDNPQYIPAEEIILNYILQSNLDDVECQKIIKYSESFFSSAGDSDFFGRLPVLYFNGRVISNRNLLDFIKDLIINPLDKVYENIFYNLVQILRNRLRFGNENYYYYKLKEKYSLEHSTRLGYFLLSLFPRRRYCLPRYERFSQEVMSHMITHQEVRTQEEISSLIILDAMQKLDAYKTSYLLMGKDTKKQQLIDLLIYGFLNEDRNLFINFARPFLENASLENYYSKIEQELADNTQSSTKITFRFTFPDLTELLKKYSLIFDPKKKKYFRSIEEIEIRKSWTNSLFSVGIFAGVTLALFVLSGLKKK